MNTALFFLKAILLGALMYALLGLLLAAIDLNVLNTERHPHGMEELLYALLPMFIAPLGALMGLLGAVRHKASGQLAAANKFAALGLPVVAVLVLVLLNYQF